MPRRLLLLLALGALMPMATASPALPESPDGRPRLIVLTDIGGDPDDTQSLVRLLTYANEFEIEGLVASASGTPGELRETTVRPDLIREVVQAYGEVRENLLRHRPGFPSRDELLARVKSGNPQRGTAGLGTDTEGSDWIIRVVDRPDPRPVNVAVWGGPTELAQALWRVRKDRDAEGLRRFLSRLRVHAIGHQDDTGPWIVEQFPGLFYILSARSEEDVFGKSRSGEDRRLSTYRGMYLGGDESLTSREWIETHVRQGHGPLGALYPPKTWTAPNPHAALKEGDTPSWFYFLSNGLNDPEHPEWGGWGGRFRRERNRLFRDAQDTVNGVTDARAAVWRWRPAFQAEFQARMDWCVRPYEEANHPPAACLNGDRSLRVLRMEVSPEATAPLSASGSSDPDGDRLTYRWWIYPEAGTYRGEVILEGADGPSCRVRVPPDAGGREIHVMLEVRDDGTPALTACRRAVLQVRERETR